MSEMNIESNRNCIEKDGSNNNNNVNECKERNNNNSKVLI